MYNAAHSESGKRFTTGGNLRLKRRIVTLDPDKETQEEENTLEMQVPVAPLHALQVLTASV